MIFDFDTINRMAAANPADFSEHCDAVYNKRVSDCARLVSDSLSRTRIALLSGPSGSGKTTTAIKIKQTLESRGVGCYVISLDDYYLDVDEATHPRDEESGNIDFESPDCLDIPLLRRHFTELSGGAEISVPKFEFSKQRRSQTRSTALRLKADEVVIFEGIHALNPLLNGGIDATKIYVSARSNVMRDGEVCFKGTWTRLARRIIRDMKFRGASPVYTMRLWSNVRKGEKRYISPFKDSADYMLNTSHSYEYCVLANYAAEIFREIPPESPRAAELKEIGPKLSSFARISETAVSESALLREFIGGSNISY